MVNCLGLLDTSRPIIGYVHPACVSILEQFSHSHRPDPRRKSEVVNPSQSVMGFMANTSAALTSAATTNERERNVSFMIIKEHYDSFQSRGGHFDHSCAPRRKDGSAYHPGKWASRSPRKPQRGLSRARRSWIPSTLNWGLVDLNRIYDFGHKL